MAEDVSVNHESIRTLAKSFLEWEKWLDGLNDPQIYKITPGYFWPQANPDLITRVNDTQKDLRSAIQNLRKVLFEVSEELTKIANTYQHAENLNKDDAQRVYGLLDKVRVTYSNLPQPKPTTT